KGRPDGVPPEAGRPVARLFASASGGCSMKRRTGRVRPRAKSETPTASAGTEWLQLRASVNYTEPPIWRRLRIPASLTLGALHHVVQTSFGWADSHLHGFSRGRAELGDAELGDAAGARQAFGRKGAEL